MQVLCGAPPLVDGSISSRQTRRAQRKVVASSTASNDTTTTSTPEIKLSGPEPKRFTVAAGQEKNIASAAFCTVARGGAGALTLGYSVNLVRETAENKENYTVASLPFGFRTQESSKIADYPCPAEPLIVYDVQDSPDSRKVREAIAILDLVSLNKPVAEGDSTFSNEAKELQGASGQPSLPFMIDPNTGIKLTSADEIVAYLFKTYGNNELPMILRKGALNDVTAKFGMLPRKGIGATYKGAKAPAQPLQYWAYEASPFCVVVRETLAELGIAHVLHPCARGSPQREVLFQRRGHFQVPYLEDPNTGVAMFESAAIIEYLRKTYGSS